MNKALNSLPSVYQPAEVEEKWQKIWSSANYFRTEPGESLPFTIVIPPPNITGSLHLGHALNNSIQDILTRFYRMLGYNSLWVPGTDHASIATQAVVEKTLVRERKLTRFDLGREEFLQIVDQWAEKYRKYIIEQLKVMGCSYDLSRERFTLDEQCTRAVKYAFKHLYLKGLIYQGEYIVNWCPKCLTALSDLEVEYIEQPSYLYYFKYPLADASGELVISTTRPETMLGDTGVAVNPKDERYSKFIGKLVKLPLVGREIPVVGDDYADPKFGTGVVKITPAHDPNDFWVGKRHDLPPLLVMDEHGVMNDNAGERYRGLDRYQCREKVLLDIQEEGCFVRQEDYLHSVGTCYRCNTVIEPYLSKQWFMKMADLAKPALEAVKDGRVTFVPERYSKLYFDWMENIRDWCISRQLWYGHRIPLWNCLDCHEVLADETDKCPKCGSSRIEQESDVLDTWFSSALWPLSTLGWPEETEDLKFYYPTTFLATAREIINLWVARMIMMGLEMRGDVPFKYVYIHPTILAPDGKRMSKSLGNGVDPLDLIKKYGSDATRFALTLLCAEGQDFRFNEEKFVLSRNFVNKIWNASRYIITSLEDFTRQNGLNFSMHTLPDNWIISRLTNTINEVTRHIKEFNFSFAARTLYNFFWNDFCDWYIEISKLELRNEETRYSTQVVLWFILSNTLKLLHPFMPHITEEIWQILEDTEKHLTWGKWPLGQVNLINEVAEEEMNLIKDVITGIRNLRGEAKIPPHKEVKVVLQVYDGRKAKIISNNENIILNLAKTEPLQFLAKSHDDLNCEKERIILEKPHNALFKVTQDIEIFLILEGLIDIEKEKERLNKELMQVKETIKKINQRLENKNFLANAPAEVVEKEKEKKAELFSLEEKFNKQLAMFD